jgi:haloalkane dehalogenase
VPLSGEPADVRDRIAAYSGWLKTASLLKLFIDAEPGVFITGRIRRLEQTYIRRFETRSPVSSVCLLIPLDRGCD